MINVCYSLAGGKRMSTMATALRCRLRSIFLCVLSVALSVSTTACSTQFPEIPITGQSDPYMKLIMLDGTVRAIGEYKGKTVVLLFWATWCGKSKRAARHLNEFAKSYARRSDIVFIAANVDDIGDSEKVRTEIRDSKLDYLTHAYSGNGLIDEAYQTLSGEGIPYFVIYDRSGRVVRTTDDYDEAFAVLQSPGSRPSRR